MSAPKIKSALPITQLEAPQVAPALVVVGSEQEKKARMIGRAQRLIDKAQTSIAEQHTTSYTDAILIARFTADLLATIDPGAASLAEEAKSLQEKQRMQWGQTSLDTQTAHRISELVQLITQQIQEIV